MTMMMNFLAVIFSTHAARYAVAYAYCGSFSYRYVHHGSQVPSVGPARDYWCPSLLCQPQDDTTGTNIISFSSIDSSYTARIFDTAKPLVEASPVSVKQKIKIVLDESELEERFVRATGNGGQKVNKSSSKVELVHRPTGLMTSCQDARDLSTNRKMARKLMVTYGCSV